jgi:DNA-binding SARP family transcriptional activator
VVAVADDFTEACDEAPARFRLKTLGDFGLFDAAGERVSPRGRKAAACLAYLALSSLARVKREALAAPLWADRPSDQARASLRQTITELRPLTLGETAPLIIDWEDLGPRKSLVVIDHEHLIGEARRGDLAAVERGLAEWSGPIAASVDGVGEAFDAWLSAFRQACEARLREDLGAVPSEETRGLAKELARSRRAFARSPRSAAARARIDRFAPRRGPSCPAPRAARGCRLGERPDPRARTVGGAASAGAQAGSAGGRGRTPGAGGAGVPPGGSGGPGGPPARARRLGATHEAGQPASSSSP